MGHLDVDKIAEAVWIMHHGIDDLYEWAEQNGLPRSRYMVVSGSISVEQTANGLMLYCEVVPLDEHEQPLYDQAKREFISGVVVLPYVFPIPEGIGKLHDWDYQVPKRKSSEPLEDIECQS